MIVKRAFDVIVATGALCICAPLFVAIAVLIRLDSPGPVFFRQERVGRTGRPFRIHKFRTMRVDTGLLITTSDDPRVTRIGRILRRTKLDELPQLVDVLGGSMSLVGPRPEVRQYVAQWPAERRQKILSVRPGITDPASIQMRNESDQLAGVPDPERYYVDVLLPIKTELYADYVDSQTFVGDVRILLQTLRAVAR